MKRSQKSLSSLLVLVMVGEQEASVSFDMLIGITDRLLSLLPVRGEMVQLVEECWPLSNCQNLGEMELLLETSHQANNGLPRVKKEKR